jgi:hypothetical protein
LVTRSASAEESEGEGSEGKCGVCDCSTFAAKGKKIVATPVGGEGAGECDAADGEDSAAASSSSSEASSSSSTSGTSAASADVIGIVKEMDACSKCGKLVPGDLYSALILRLNAAVGKGDVGRFDCATWVWILGKIDTAIQVLGLKNDFRIPFQDNERKVLQSVKCELLPLLCVSPDSPTEGGL